MTIEESIGICAICGENKQLTFEHVPPRATFNSSPTKIVTGEYILGRIDKLPWELDNCKYVNMQRGTGYQQLCASCNNYFGNWYVPTYVKFVNTLAKLAKDNNFQTNTKLRIELEKVDILPIFKQILTMFCTANNSIFEDEKLRNFLLEKENTNFDKSKYRLCVYFNNGKLQRFCPKFAIWNKSDKSCRVVSEIGSIPLGFLLYFDPKDDDLYFGTDISNFADAKFNTEYSLSFSLNILELNSLMIEDFRSKEEILKTIKESIRWLKENKKE